MVNSNVFEINLYDSKESVKIKSKTFDLYAYSVYIGNHSIEVEQGDSLWMVNKDSVSVHRHGVYTSDTLGVVIRGYQCANRMSSFEDISNLPYVNGCSSNQLLHPIRPGDPTFQLLHIPPNTVEQKHHVHSTARVVYVYDGEGESVQGQDGSIIQKLKKGDVIILDKMTPHHFQTKDTHLIVLPLHIFSSTSLEFDHPMFNGTHKI